MTSNPLTQLTWTDASGSCGRTTSTCCTVRLTRSATSSRGILQRPSLTRGSSRSNLRYIKTTRIGISRSTKIGMKRSLKCLTRPRKFLKDPRMTNQRLSWSSWSRISTYSSSGTLKWKKIKHSRARSRTSFWRLSTRAMRRQLTTSWQRGSPTYAHVLKWIIT